MLVLDAVNARRTSPRHDRARPASAPAIRRLPHSYTSTFCTVATQQPGLRYMLRLSSHSRWWGRRRLERALFSQRLVELVMQQAVAAHGAAVVHGQQQADQQLQHNGRDGEPQVHGGGARLVPLLRAGQGCEDQRAEAHVDPPHKHIDKAEVALRVRPLGDAQPRIAVRQPQVDGHEPPAMPRTLS